MARQHTSPWVRFVIRTLSIRGTTWWILALSLAATGLACRQAWQAERKSQSMGFESDSAALRDAVTQRLNHHVQMLQGVRGLFAASEEVEASEFRAYVDSLDHQRDYPEIRCMGYIQRVDSGSADPPPKKGMIIRYAEPQATNMDSVGRDLAEDPNQWNTAWMACDSAMPRLSPKTTLATGSEESTAVIYEAVFQNGHDPLTASVRHRDLKGWVYASFHIAELMNTARRATRGRLDYEVYDGESATIENLLCRSSHDGGDSPNRLSQVTTLRPFGHPWTLRLRTPADIGGGGNLLPVGMLAGGGVAISFLLFGLAQSMATTGQRACKIALGMTGELQQQKEALRMSEERLELVIEGSNDGIWDWNVETNEVYFSPRWKGMLGYDDHEIANTFSSWEGLLHPDDRERAMFVLRRYLGNETPFYQIEHRLRHKDGTYRWILSRGVARRDETGKPVRMAGSHVDLTELKKAEQDLLRANRDLHQSQTHLKTALADLGASHAQLEKTQLELIQAAKLESVGTLAAGVAHEVKNPLQIILMGLDYLDQRLAGVEEDTIVTLHDMRDAALRADAITRELLKFSTATEFDPAPADLTGVLERSLWLLRTDLNRAGVTLVKHLAEKLPPVLIDTPKIQQVLINVINNSLQAMNYKGTLMITTTTNRLENVLPERRQSPCLIEPAEEVVILKIHDSGPGIPDDLLLRIFDPFFTTKAVGAGSGLGLSVVKKIIELHRACIHIQNSPSGGAEVILAFAINRQHATPPAGHVHRV